MLWLLACQGPVVDPFADVVVSFAPGPGSGFGQDALPDVVLGPPSGTLAGTPSLDVLSLGEEGEVVLEFVDLLLRDESGPDLIVFENPMSAWKETAIVGVSVDGVEFVDFPCDPEDVDGSFPGCAGTRLVFAGPDAADPTDPETAGGDAFDLEDVGLEEARFVRLRDTGFNAYDGATGGFDLDAIVSLARR